jgi:hypothetical protein
MAIKTDWTETKQYFKRLACNFEIYEQNSSSTTGKGKYKSANQATKAAKDNNSGTTLPPSWQQQSPKTTSRTRLLPTFEAPHKRKLTKW